MQKSLTPFNIIPAIDLLDGRCIRLFQGRFDRISRYAADPVALAKVYEQAGARCLHVVDLDGAKKGAPCQQHILERMAAATNLQIGIGGGIRTPAQSQAYVNSGASRIVLGSIAVDDPLTTHSIIAQCGAEKVTLAFDFAIDASGATRPAVQGWSALKAVPTSILFDRYREWAHLNYICTNIARDGSLEGIDAAFYKNLHEQSQGADIMASGGIASLDDIRLARDLNLSGAILGKALYEGRFSLEEALRC